MKVGVIGCGVVGSAVVEGLSAKGVDNISVFDPNVYPDSELGDILDTDIVFVCVPTPTHENGTQNLVPLKNTLDGLAARKYSGIVSIKSTTLPVHILEFEREYECLRIVANPEFLTAANAKGDFQRQRFIIVGGNNKTCRDTVARFYKKYWPSSSVHRTNLVEAMMIKYVINCMLATRITLMNEIVMAHQNNGLEFDWNKVIEGVSLDYRSGRSHMQVPGPDGKLGYGGVCFIKDVLSMACCITQSTGYDMLKAVHLINWSIRGEEVKK